MTLDQPSRGALPSVDDLHSEATTPATPALIVRVSAIGDTLIAARTQAQLRARGYAPILVTHKNNASLLSCMPLLQGACLVSDSLPSFFWRNSEREHLHEVGESEFLSALKDQLHTANSPQNGKSAQLTILDLQNTTRSKRAIADLVSRFKKAELKIKTHKVAKLSLWRLLLVLLSFFARRQWMGRKTPTWLQKRLKPVHRLQQELVETLPRRLVHPPPEHPQALQTQVSLPTGIERGHVVFMVGASLPLKSWPKESYRTLQNMILDRTALSVVLCGGVEDIQVGHYLDFANHERVINQIGKTTLAETLSLIRSARYVITGDSFASHAADLFGTPASVLFGATHPLLGFAPVGSHINVHHTAVSCSPCSRHGQGHCRFKNIRCLSSIKPEEVFSKIESVLK